MQVQELMTSDPACCTPEQSVREAARLMREHDCGCIPVEDPRNHRLLGVVTDRDIAVRVVGGGGGADTRVRDAMTRDPACCHAEDELDKVESIMSERQVRRVPVIDGDGCCVGMVCQADLALAMERSNSVSPKEVAMVLERISEPNGESKSPPASGRGPTRHH